MAIIPPPLSELERRLGMEAGTLEGADKGRAESTLEDATAMALAEVPPAVAKRWMENGAPTAVVVVILKAARREFENPQGLYQETVGEHSMGVTTATGLYLTAEEKSQLAKAASGKAGFTGTVRTPSAYGKGDTRPAWWDWHCWEDDGWC